MVSGKPPFVGAGVGEIFAQKIYEKAPRAQARAPEISPALAGVIDRALARSPEARFPSMSAMAQAIADVASRPLPVAAARSRRVVVAAVIVLLAVVAAVLVAARW
jgi:eukaryotic-like serine/threonine-protein kinase